MTPQKGKTVRRSLAVALLACIVVGTTILPVEAKKSKKKKAKKPITFSAEGSFALGNPGDLMGAGITRNEFIETCALPASQGVDGHVIEVDGPIADVTSDIFVSGTGAVEPDLDMYLYSESCSPMGSYSTASSSEAGVMVPGTRFVVVTAFIGAQIEFEFKATESR